MANANQELALENLDQASGGGNHHPIHHPIPWQQQDRLATATNAQVTAIANALFSIHLF